jgi:hypothetical protein
MEIITLREVLAEMEKREIPFSVTFITLDLKRDKGGDIVTIENGMLSGKGNEVKLSTKAVNQLMKFDDYEHSRNSKRPNHYENRTRNIRILGTSQIRKLHIRLITEFNGKKVYY